MSSDSSSTTDDDSRILAAYHEALVGDSDQSSSNSAESDNLHGALHVLRMMERARRVEIEDRSSKVELEGRSSDDSPINLPDDRSNRIGRFEIVRKLGEGGNGTVLLVLDPKLDRQVALKVPNPEALFNKDFTERFRREAQLAARLRHPNIVSVYETGSIGPVSYIASAFCNGPTLSQWLKQDGERFSPNNAARLMRALAAAVQHAHSRGILHRDIKPSNILFDSPEATSLAESNLAEAARLADFGLAKQLADDTTLTAAAAVLGTPAYMAPEQAEGRHDDVGTHSDIFSLGCVLHELLTGDAPFRRGSTLATLQAVRNEEPKSSQSLSSVPRDLAAICLKCLEKKPKDRYASASALFADLDAFLNNRPVSARPMTLLQRAIRWASRNKPLAGLIATVAVMSIALLVGSILVAVKLSRSNNSVRESERQAQETLLDSLLVQAKSTRKSGETGQRVDTLQSVARAVSLAKQLDVFDKYKVPLRSEAMMANSLWDVRPVRQWPSLDGDATSDSGRTELDQFRFVNQDFTEYATISPDSKDFVVRRMDDDSSVATYSCAGDPSISRIMGSVQWSPNSKFVIARAARKNLTQRLLVWDCESCELVAQFRLSKIAPGSTATSRKQFDFSEDGRLLALCGLSRVVVIDAATWSTLQKHETDSTPRCVEFHPDSKHLAISWRSKIVVVNTESLETVHSLPIGRFSHQMIWSKSGDKLVAAMTNKLIGVWDLKEGTSFILNGHGHVVTTAQFLPNEKLLMSGSWDGTTRIWDLEQQEEILLIEDGILDRLSSDGRTFSTNRGVFEVLRPTRKFVQTNIIESQANYPASPHWYSLHPSLPLLAASSHEYLTLFDLRTDEVLFSAKVPGRCEFNRAGNALWFGITNLTKTGENLCRVPLCIEETAERINVYLESEVRVPLVDTPETLDPATYEGSERLRSGGTDSGRCSIVGVQDQPEHRLFRLNSADETIRMSGNLGSAWRNRRISADGTTFIGESFHRRPSKILDFATGETLAVVPGAEYFKFSPDSQLLVAVSSDASLFYQRGEDRWELAGQVPGSGNVSGLIGGAFSADGKMAAFGGSAPGTIAFVDVASLEVMATLSIGDRLLPRSVWFSPDGRKMIVAPRSPERVEVWDLATLRKSIGRLGLDWEQANNVKSGSDTWAERKPITLHFDEGSLMQNAKAAKEEAANVATASEREA